MNRRAFMSLSISTLGALSIYGASRLDRKFVTAVGADKPKVLLPLEQAPDFDLRTLDGRAVKLAEFRGKVVALNFWATYCAPCRVETPWLVDLYRRYKDQGLEIVGVSLDDY